MTQHADAVKWNGRYRQDGTAWLNRSPRPLLTHWLPRLPKQGLALDAAAGVALHGQALARHGLHVIALDIAEVGLRLAKQQAITEGVFLETAVIDLTTLWLPPNTFDVIVNFRYLERHTFAVYRQALKPGGWLLFETFLRPSPATPDPHYYLEPGELKAAFAGWHIHLSQTNRGCNGRVTDQLVAQKPAK
ncbi:MAG: class I SAM-dependent methyltransferase [Candidatus Promineifilaceae bacterium]